MKSRSIKRKIDKMANVILIGSLPKPIGGVSTFVYRLCHKDQGSNIEEVIDPYYAIEKEILPDTIKYTNKGKRGNRHVWLFRKLLQKRKKIIHFNFSSTRSLILFLALPKGKNKWILTLHNGELSLEGYFLNNFGNKIFKKIDTFICLSPKQKKFYTENHIDKSKIIEATSYISPPVMQKHDEYFYAQWLEKSKNYSSKFVASGYPTKIYNHLSTLQELIKYHDAFLTLFLYGEDNDGILDEILEYKHYENIEIYLHRPQNDFNKVLANSCFYLRPNSVDSFGIAVADAVNMGLTVIASDVCQRYEGSILFHTLEQYGQLIKLSTEGSMKSNHTSSNLDSYSKYIEIYNQIK